MSFTSAGDTVVVVCADAPEALSSNHEAAVIAVHVHTDRKLKTRTIGFARASEVPAAELCRIWQTSARVQKDVSFKLCSSNVSAVFSG
jgi:hypothetical protein